MRRGFKAAAVVLFLLAAMVLSGCGTGKKDRDTESTVMVETREPDTGNRKETEAGVIQTFAGSGEKTFSEYTPETLAVFTGDFSGEDAAAGADPAEQSPEEAVPDSPDKDFIFTIQNDRATITGYQGNGGKVKIPEHLGGADSIYIEHSAFRSADTITWIYLPETVCDIAPWAFCGCDALEEVYIRGGGRIGEYAFTGCNKLRKVDMLSSVDQIYERAFEDDDQLKEVIFPPALTSIGEWAFSGCVSLEEAELEGTALTRIEGNAFGKCRKLTYLSLPATLDAAEDGFYYWDYKGLCSTAFVGCRSLGNVVIDEKNPYLELEDGVLYANNAVVTMFQGYENTDVVIRDGTEWIGSFAFYGNKNLRSIVIPESVKWLSYLSFGRCSALTEVKLPDTVEEIEDRTFFRCTSLKNAVIGNGIQNIPDQAFAFCTSLENVTLGNQVASIGMGAFQNCCALKKIKLPDTATCIGQSAFVNCTELERINLPDQFEEYFVYGYITPTSTSTVFENCVKVVITYRGREYGYQQAEKLDAALEEVMEEGLKKTWD